MKIRVGVYEWLRMHFEIGSSNCSNWRSPSPAGNEELEKLWSIKDRLQIDNHDGLLRLQAVEITVKRGKTYV